MPQRFIYTFSRERIVAVIGVLLPCVKITYGHSFVCNIVTPMSENTNVHVRRHDGGRFAVLSHEINEANDTLVSDAIAFDEI